MSMGQGFFAIFAIGVGLSVLYGLHRLALWLEECGHLYYLHKKPSGGSAAGGFVAFQRIVEPQAHYVQLVREEASTEENESEGPEDPSAAAQKNREPWRGPKPASPCPLKTPTVSKRLVDPSIEVQPSPLD
jgi:hypothetical protein